MSLEHRKILKPVNKPCSFCENKTEPSYKEPKFLKPLLTEKGKIVGRMRTGVCLKHQRSFTLAVKRARYMALLPFVSMVK